jgi:fatty-acid desaturase
VPQETTLPPKSTRTRPHGHQTAPLPQTAPELPKSQPAQTKKQRQLMQGASGTFRFRDQFPNGINWVTTGWMTVMHVGAIAALWHITWQAMAVFFVLHYVTACWGITLGYHRLLTHGSLVVSRPVRIFFSICGTISAEGSPLYWVATHRKHHVLSDQEGDPHSPNDGFWWSHMLWFQPKETAEQEQALFKRWAPDMYADPVQRFLHKTFIVYPIMLGIALYGLGHWWIGNGLSFVLLGLCARMVVCYHCTWFVNSATHVWGYRNYESTDRSRNLWWVSLLSYGEGWHNNHHAHQRLAKHGHRWFELDVTYRTIWVLKMLGLAKNVQDELPKFGPRSEPPVEIV